MFVIAEEHAPRRAKNGLSATFCTQKIFSKQRDRTMACFMASPFSVNDGALFMICDGDRQNESSLELAFWWLKVGAEIKNRASRRLS